MNKLANYLTKETIFIGITVSAAFLLSSALIGNAVSHLKSSDEISVSGTAEKFVTSDSGKWAFSITETADPVMLKQSSKNLRDEIDTIAKYLTTSRKIDGAQINVMPVVMTKLCASNQQESYGEGGKDCSGAFSYVLTQKITVTSSDVAMIKDLSLNANTALGAQNISIKTDGVEYYYNGLTALKTELLTEAMKNAKERAEALAKSTNSSIGGVKNASQGVFQITGKNSVDVSDYGSYDTSEIDKKVTAVVRASFSVK